LCAEFAAAGYDVIATDREESGIESGRFVRADLRGLCGDARQRSEIISAIKAALQDRPLHALVNNAAVQILGGTTEISVSDWHETLNINLVAPFVLAQQLLPELEAAHGSVVNVASIHATATKPGFVCYATSKAALVGMTRAMAVDLGARVRVNALLPAAVATSMLVDGFAGNPEGLAQLAGMHPINRIADQAEIARTAVFLASDAATFITGSALHVDGGIGARLHDPA
jgi:NAD(P)-dependent dehydrogenase (short-subunit alcohol dehydrogenase family)